MPRLAACPFESRSSANAGVGVRGGVTGEAEATPTTAEAADCECESDGEWLASAWVGDSCESWPEPYILMRESVTKAGVELISLGPLELSVCVWGGGGA